MAALGSRKYTGVGSKSAVKALALARVPLVQNDSTYAPENDIAGGTATRGGPDVGSSAVEYDIWLRSRLVLVKGCGSRTLVTGSYFPVAGLKAIWVSARRIGAMFTRNTAPELVSTHACAPATVASLSAAVTGRTSSAATSTGSDGNRIPGPFDPGRLGTFALTGMQALSGANSAGSMTGSTFVSHSLVGKWTTSTTRIEPSRAST